jgi:hypothetical protein
MMMGVVLALSLPLRAGASVVFIEGATGGGDFTNGTSIGTTGVNLSSATTKLWNYASTEADWAITGGQAVADSVAGTGLGQLFLKSNYGTAWTGVTQITLSVDWTTRVAGDKLEYSVVGWKHTGTGSLTFGLASGTIISGSTYYSVSATDSSSFLSGGAVLATVGSGVEGSGTFSATLDVVGTDLADYDALSIVFFSTVGSGGMVTVDNVRLSASAPSPVITNFSFELPVTSSDGAMSTNEIEGWVKSGGATIGVFNPSTNYYTNSAVTDTNSGVLGTMDSKSALFFSTSTNDYVTQTLATDIVVSNTYTLTVAVGDRDAGGRPGFAGYDIQLLAGGLAVATNASAMSPGDGTFTDVKLVYTAQVGDAGLLGIRIGPSNAGSGKALDVDNVRLISSSEDPAVDPLIAIDSLQDRQIVQRDLTGHAVLSLSGTLWNAVGTEVQARAIAIDGNGTDTGWVSIDSEPDEGAYAGTLEVAEGWYQVEVRLMDGAEVVLTDLIEHVGVGDIFITCGQSNSANFGTGTPSAADDRVSYMGLLTGTWVHADDPPENPSAYPGTDGSPWPKLGDLLSANDDVPIGFVSIGDGGSSVEEWTPDQSDNYPNLQTAVQSFGTNGFRAVLWHQGERDAYTLNTAQTNYVTSLETIIAVLVSTQAGRSRGLWRWCPTMGERPTRRLSPLRSR